MVSRALASRAVAEARGAGARSVREGLGVCGAGSSLTLMVILFRGEYDMCDIRGRSRVGGSC